MKGTIITNPYDKNPVQIRKAERMRQEFQKLGVQTQIVANDNFVAYLSKDGVVCDLQTDFVLYFDKDKYISQLLEQSGIAVFNCSSATSLCDDKMQTHIALCGQVPMPKTLSGALCYTLGGKVDDSYVDKAIDILRLPMVAKQCYGSFGEQVYLVNTKQELVSLLNKIKNKAYLLQEYVQPSHGKDLRVIVIGKKVVCAMLRQNDKDFRSNISLGGNGVKYDLSAEITDICQKTATILNLDYCGIDILLGESPLVCEVNSNAMFEGIEQATGVNVASLYAQHIVNSLKK